METTAKRTTITVTASIKASPEKVWKFWTEPDHVIQWNNASPDWHSPRAENDLRTGGKFLYRMEARDGSSGFDFTGVYDHVEPLRKIAYTMDDGRKATITFQQQDDHTIVNETFEAENVYSIDMQRDGWQAILNNFKKHVESGLERLHFEILINAKPEDVYRIMLDEKSYGEWTSVFDPSSRFKGSWEKGSKILFIGEDENGQEQGMVSRVAENIPSRFVSIEHMGILQEGKEVTGGTATEAWAGAMENYTFTPQNGKTLLSVDTDTLQEYKAYFSNTWPTALEKLKSLCETE